MDFHPRILVRPQLVLVPGRVIPPALVVDEDIADMGAEHGFPFGEVIGADDQHCPFGWVDHHAS